MMETTKQSTVSYYEYRNAIKEANDAIEEKYGWRAAQRTVVSDMSDWKERIGKVGVNWSAIGTVDSADALAFAEQLQYAAEIAANFKYNGYDIER